MTGAASQPDEVRLPFGPGDRLIQVHANGAILVVAPDYQWNLATAGQAYAVALEAAGNNNRVLLAHAVLDDATVAVLETVRQTGAQIVDFGTAVPPMTWPNGTTPMMTAATTGRVDLVEDLIARGFPVDHADDVGATALHHAAHAGDIAAVDALLDAGADPTVVDSNGRTPADLARTARHFELAARLYQPAGDIRFGPRTWFRWAYLMFGSAGVFALCLWEARNLAMPWSLLALALAAGVVWVMHHLPLSYVPIRLRADGTLVLFSLAGRRELPLSEVQGVLAVPAYGVNGAPWQVALFQDRLGRRTTPARIRHICARYIHAEDTDTFSTLTERHVRLVLGRGKGTDRVLSALRWPLSRPGLATNHVWDLLEAAPELYQRR